MVARTAEEALPGLHNFFIVEALRPRRPPLSLPIDMVKSDCDIDASEPEGVIFIHDI